VPARPTIDQTQPGACLVVFSRAFSDDHASCALLQALLLGGTRYSSPSKGKWRGNHGRSARVGGQPGWGGGKWGWEVGVGGDGK
jgi:hypothetical protein